MHKYKLLRMKRAGRKFKKEHKKEIRLLIAITLGFTIAFTWRQTIFDSFQVLVNFFVDTKSSALSSILTSSLITLVSIALIRITSHILKENHEN